MRNHQTNLTGVPETMLWTLHNRASEALRKDAWISDEHAIALYGAIDYDYRRSFGAPDSSHAVRSLAFDQAVRDWMAAYPGGPVIELGCGLETQFQRTDDGRVQWYCVDLPRALAVRERFLAPSARCRHIACSALDFSWMDQIASTGPCFVSMQGLLMYFEPDQVATLLQTVLARFPGSTLMFDVIPRWFSRKTLRGLHKTPHYRLPPMPWGIDRHQIAPQLERWNLPLASLTLLPYRRLRGFPFALMPWLSHLPWLGHRLPGFVLLQGRPVAS